MDILQYLIELLKTRKQIGIEGLGTLYKKKTPGRYDAETHSFLPPSYTLEFTADVLEHTNLAQYIQNKRGISEDSAKYFISQFVSEIHNGLQQGQYSLENLGVFTKENGQLNFAPSQNINTGFDFFALPAVTAELPKVDTPVQEKDITPNQQKDLAEEPQIEQVQVPEFEQEVGRVNQSVEEEVAVEEEHSERVVEEEVSENIEVESQPETAEEEVFEEITEVNTTDTDEETNEELVDNTSENNQEEHQPEAAVENESIEEEVFEEISEVTPETANVKPEPEQRKEQNDTWDFDGENVVSEEDVHEPEKSEEEKVETELIPDKAAEDFTLTSTTHDWSFDSVRNEKIKEDPILENEFDQHQLSEDTEEERKMPFYQKLLIGLAILLTGLAIAYVAKPELFEDFSRNTTNPDQKIAVPIERSNLKTQQDSLDFADSIMETAEKVGLDVKPAKDTLKVTTTKTEVKPAITYDIIAAAFAKQSEVDEYIAYMKSKGFDAKIANMPGKIYKKISIASYNNIDSAEKNVVKFRKQLKNTKIYVQKIKNN
jgi:nucleoid DNA-binding protein